MTFSFSYWDGTDKCPIRNFVNTWIKVLPNHTVIGPAAAADLISLYFEDRPQYLKAFLSINIPAAKSDIARYLVLHHLGGLYLDVHFGYDILEEVQDFLTSPSQYDATLINVLASLQPRLPEQIRVINGLIICKPRHPLLLAAAKAALENVSRKMEQERLVGYEPYNIYFMTGPGLLNDIFFSNPFTLGAKNIPRLKAEAEGTRIINEEVLPVKRNVFKSSYSAPGSHWSERQRRELLCH
jgi:hypothetical protein